MAERVLLHIGAPKSGTTYLQSILWGNRHVLREAGVLVPGRNPVDFNLAAAAVRIRHPGNGRPARTWRRLVDECAAWPATSVLSAEWFCRTPDDLIPRMVGAFAPADVQIVYTARALVPLVTAAWQESLKTGHRESLPEFVASLDDDERRWSWHNIDPSRVLARWSQHVPAEKIHVVTVPAPGSDPLLLLRRFAAPVGFAPDACDTTVAQVNESLSVEAAELVRRVAPRIDDIVGFSDLPWHERYRWLRRYFAHGLLAPLPGHRIALDADHAAAIAARAERAVASLGAAGHPVSGDLEDITRTPVHPDAVRPADVSDTQLLELAVPVMAELVARVREATLDQDGARPDQASSKGRGRG
ncbi:MAG: hypothetical protein ACRDO4_03540 [Nocardioides sp.]